MTLSLLVDSHNGEAEIDPPRPLFSSTSSPWGPTTHWDSVPVCWANSTASGGLCSGICKPRCLCLLWASYCSRDAQYFVGFYSVGGFCWLGILEDCHWKSLAWSDFSFWICLVTACPFIIWDPRHLSGPSVKWECPRSLQWSTGLLATPFYSYIQEFIINVVQSFSPVWLSVTHGLQHTRLPCLFFTISRSLLKLMSIGSVMPSSHLILCHPLLLLPSIFPSIRVFSNESILCIGWPKYLTSVLPIFQGWFPLGLTGLITLLSKSITHHSWVFSKREKELQRSSKRTLRILCSIILPRNWQNHPFFV